MLPAALALVLTALLPPAAADVPAVGQPFPALVLPTVDRQQVLSLDGFRGRKVLLLEFASW